MGPEFALIGLGNPGAQYAASRHNVGFMVIDLMATDLKVGLSPLKRPAEPGNSVLEKDGLVGLGRIRGHDIIMGKPLTFMNNSGRFVLRVLRQYGLPECNLVVIHDDMDLEPGQIRVKRKGSSGGHRGVQSIIDAVGSEDFGRVKVGIGRPPGGMDPRDYVLNKVNPMEGAILKESISRVLLACYEVVENGYESAMNLFNARAVDSEST